MKKFSRSFFFIGFFLASLSFASSKKAPKNTETIEILSYSSFSGSGSLGEWLLGKEKGICSGGTCRLSHPHPNRSLYEELRYRREHNIPLPDIVFGLDSLQKKWAEEAKIIRENPLLVGRSPLVFLLKSSELKKISSPLSWKDIPKKFPKGIIIQDPRFSSLGQTLLSFTLGQKLLTLAEIKAFTKRVFPKWSASYEFFLSSSAQGIWTFATSYSYHLCENASPAVGILPLKEAYPEYQEWAALIDRSQSMEREDLARAVLRSMKDGDFQTEVMKKNWLLPGDPATPIIPCFQAETFPKTTESGLPSVEVFGGWIDGWSL